MTDTIAHVRVDHGMGPTCYSVTFHLEALASSATFQFEQTGNSGAAVDIGATSPDDWTTGWLTWAADSTIVVAFAAPYLRYAGWLVLDGAPPDETDGDQSQYWESLAAQLVAHTYALDRPGSRLWEAASSGERLPQGRAYSGG